MSKKMTSRERIGRAISHREPDFVPVFDTPWPATRERWIREGMPEDADYRAFFGLDMLSHIWPDTSPRYPVATVEENDEYRIFTTDWGVTMKKWKHTESTPQYIDFTVIDPDSWRDARARMTPVRDRINWKQLAVDYPRWRAEGHWIEAHFWFGFDVTHSWFVGTERLLMALVENPEWCREMFETELDMSIALFDMLWDAGYTVDGIFWPDDMGYKLNQFFSVATYRELIKPVHRRAVEWAHGKGIPARLHSCGDIRPFVPEFVDIGVDCLHPMEVKAGVDPLALKREFGDHLALNGGLNALLYDDPVNFGAEMRRVVPGMKQGGGYLLSSDHSIPSSVSLESFRTIVKLARELGAY